MSSLLESMHAAHARIGPDEFMVVDMPEGTYLKCPSCDWRYDVALLSIANMRKIAGRHLANVETIWRASERPSRDARPVVAHG